MPNKKKAQKKKPISRPAKKVSTKKITKSKALVKAPTADMDQALAPITSHSKYFIPKTWISEKQVLQILQRTPKEHIYQRKGKAGQTWDYVTGNYVEKVLNYVFGWNWDFEIVKQELIGDKGKQQVITLGKLVVKDDQGHEITKSQNGRKDVAYKKDTTEYLDLGNDYKASATDCLKKCASLLGIASDLYGKQEFREITTDKQVVQASVAVSEKQPVQTAVTVEAKKINYYSEIAQLLIKNGVSSPGRLYKQLGISHLISEVMTQADYFNARAKLMQYFNGK